MKNCNYRKYVTLKKQFEVSYRGIKISELLAIQIWYWANDKKCNYRQIAGFLRCLDYGFLKNPGKDYLLFSSTIRKDHSKTFQEIAEKVTDKYDVINKFDGIHKGLSFSPRNIIRAILFTFFHLSSLGLFKRLCIAGYLCLYYNSIDKLYRMNKRPLKCLVVLSAVHEDMNLLCQLYSLSGARVVGLSHGVTFIYENDIPVDCVNYENLRYECIVWSDLTRNEMVKYGIDESRLFVAGYPKKVKLLEVEQNNKMQDCLVLLCRKTYDESNEHLIEILKQFSSQINFHLKLHPSCDYLKYEIMCKENNLHIIPKEKLLTECMDNKLYDFSIAVNTTTYYEIQIAGIPCLRFDDGGAYDLTPGCKEDIFNSSETLSKCIDWLSKSKMNGEYSKTREKLLQFNLGIGIDKYRSILTSF